MLQARSRVAASDMRPRSTFDAATPSEPPPAVHGEGTFEASVSLPPLPVPSSAFVRLSCLSPFLSFFEDFFDFFAFFVFLSRTSRLSLAGPLQSARMEPVPGSSLGSPSGPSASSSGYEPPRVLEWSDSVAPVCPSLV